MPDVVMCGEALVDLVPVHEGPLLSPKLGGGPFNVAVAIGRLGSPVAYLSRIFMLSTRSAPGTGR